MSKIIRITLSSGRRCRRLAVGMAIWLLRQVSDVEKDEMWRCNDMLDSIDLDAGGISRHRYELIEMECEISEFALAYIESAIEELEYAYD